MKRYRNHLYRSLTIVEFKVKRNYFLQIPYTTVYDIRQFEYFDRWQFWAHYKIIMTFMNEVIQRENAAGNNIDKN